MALVPMSPKNRRDSKESNGSSLPAVSNLSSVVWRRMTSYKSKGEGPVFTQIEEVTFIPNVAYNLKGCVPSLPSATKPLKSRHKHTCSSKKRDTAAGEKKKVSSTVMDILKMIALAIIVGCSLYLWFFFTYENCGGPAIDINLLESSLKSKMIGQEKALNSLVVTLTKMSKTEHQPPIVLLSGSPGVGKTLVINQLVDDFKGLSQVFRYILPSPAEVVEKLNSCRPNLLVIDGFSFKDAFEVATWTSQILKAASSSGKKVWLLAAFTTWFWSPSQVFRSEEELSEEVVRNSQNMDDVIKLFEFTTERIKFKPMEVHHVREFVLQTVDALNLEPVDDRLESIVHQLTSTPALRWRGCNHIRNFLLLS